MSISILIVNKGGKSVKTVFNTFLLITNNRQIQYEFGRFYSFKITPDEIL